MRSYTPLKKELSAVVVLITHLGQDCCCGCCTDVVLGSGWSVMRKIVNLFVGIRIAPPSEVPDHLYALFEYRLTYYVVNFRCNRPN